MSIIPFLNHLCPYGGPDSKSYEKSVNDDLLCNHADVTLGFFCIIDMYWGND